MEKEIDPMLEKFYEGVEFEEENKGDEKTAEELEAEKAEQERLAEEQRLKDEEEANKDKRGGDEEDKAKQERLAKEEEEKNRSDFSDKKNEEVDNSEWLKDFETALLKKNEYKSLSSEQKALAYLKEQNPYLDEEDLVFKAAQEFGIGATELSEEDLELMTESEKRAYKAEQKAQEIKRKGLLHEAEGFFKEQSDAIELPKVPNPIEKDEEYKAYKENIKKQAELDIEMAKEQEELFTAIDTTAIKLEKIDIEPKITLDDSEFTFTSEFKLDENKRKELAQFAKDYTPTQAEQDTFYPQGGKFNAEGYLSHLAEKLFHKQIINAAVKEGIAKAREEFVEKDLKNSTLRNNSTMQQSNRDVDPEIAAMRA